MPKWNCPDCGATHAIADDKIGTLVTCLKCGRDAISEVAKQHPSVDKGSRKPPREYVANVAKALLACASLGLMIVGAAVLSSDKPAMGGYVFAVGFAIGIQAVLVWPIYTMAEDARASRRLLERVCELLSKRP